METNKYIEEIQESKVPIVLDESWYFHDYENNLDTLKRILEKGLLSKKLLGFKNTKNTYNGVHYISVTKYSNENKENSIFKLIKGKPLIIIDNKIKAHKAEIKSPLIYHYLTNTPLPYRMSPYIDEWQVYKRIAPEHFTGIYLDLVKHLKYNTQLEQLVLLYKLVELLDYFNLNIPVIDGSDNTRLDKKVIRKIKF